MLENVREMNQCIVSKMNLLLCHIKNRLPCNFFKMIIGHVERMADDRLPKRAAELRE